MPFLRHELSEPLETSRGAVVAPVVALGNFDGVHRGHRAVLDRALAVARDEGRPALVLSFEPHPRTLFKPDSPVFRLTPEDDKARILEALGFDGLATLPFTREVAGTAAADFVETYLAERLGAAHVVSGFNFHFGRKREGTPERLRELGREHGIGVTLVDAYEEEGEALSSSRIRRLLGDGDVAAAARALGHRWSVSGEIVRGQQLGRTLGFPTANIVPDPANRLAHGIYAVRYRRGNGDLHDGVASFGRRPTVELGAPWLETFLFDFDGNLYSEQGRVALFERLRQEEAFSSVKALTEQMHRDAGAAREIMSQVEPLGELDRILNFS